jgi:hypothetical protein
MAEPEQLVVESAVPHELEIDDLRADTKTFGEEQPLLPASYGDPDSRDESLIVDKDNEPGIAYSNDSSKKRKDKRVPTRIEAAIAIQTMYRIRKSKKILRAIVCSVYTKVWDKWSETYFYKDLRTGETSWDKPEFMGTEDLPR